MNIQIYNLIEVIIYNIIKLSNLNYIMVAKEETNNYHIDINIDLLILNIM
jgi:hypothetical protein